MRGSTGQRENSILCDVRIVEGKKGCSVSDYFLTLRVNANVLIKLFQVDWKLMFSGNTGQFWKLFASLKLRFDDVAVSLNVSVLCCPWAQFKSLSQFFFRSYLRHHARNSPVKKK